MSKSALIIGGGVAGCAAAHQLVLMGGWDVTLIESAPFLGAGVRTFWHGGHPYTFGPRHFLTPNEKVFDYFDRLITLRPLPHQFLTYIEADRQFYNLPIHIDDVEKMPERDEIYRQLDKARPVQESDSLADYWRNSVGNILYEKLVRDYNLKMWGVSAEEIDTYNWSPKGATLKTGPRAAFDGIFSAYPYAADGYNRYFDLSTQGVHVRLNTRIESFNFEERAIWTEGEYLTYDIIVCTISPDVPYNYAHGALPYLGRTIHKVVFPVEFVLPPDVYWIYDAGNKEKWTRIVEYKKFTGHESPHTLIGLEIPSDEGKHYPLPLKKFQRQAQLYYDLMPPGVFCMGRNGSYRYGVNIADCIEQAFELRELLSQGGQDHAVVSKKWQTI